MKTTKNAWMLSRLAHFVASDRMNRMSFWIRHGLFAACLGWAAVALAQTPISGLLTESAHWTQANSPYLVSDQVVLDNDAVPDIAARVDIYMPVPDPCGKFGKMFSAAVGIVGV